jgi:hypothetical protein
MRWRQCDSPITRWRQCDNAKTTVRYRDVDNGIVLWPLHYRTVVIVLSHCSNRIIALSPLHFYIVVIALSYCRHRTLDQKMQTKQILFKINDTMKLSVGVAEWLTRRTGYLRISGRLGLNTVRGKFLFPRARSFTLVGSRSGFKSYSISLQLQAYSF